MKIHCIVYLIAVCFVSFFVSTGTAAQLQVEFPKQDADVVGADIAPDGSVGALYSLRKVDSQIRLYSLSPSGSVVTDELIDVGGETYDSSYQPFLIYDDSGTAHVFIYRHPDLLHLTRSGSTWTSAIVYPTSAYNVWQVRYRDGAFHVIAFARSTTTLNCATQDNTLLYINNLNGSWQSQELPSQQSDTKCLIEIDLAVGPQGIAHLI